MGVTVLTNSVELEGVTAELSAWIHSLNPSDIPPEVLTRVKYQILDGVACALVGARVPWSEKYVQATLEYEPPGKYSVIGYEHVNLSFRAKHCDETVSTLTVFDSGSVPWRLA